MSEKPHKLTAEEIIYAYCANEMYSGYPCGTEGCPHRGGPENVEETKKRIAAYMKRRDK